LAKLADLQRMGYPSAASQAQTREVHRSEIGVLPLNYATNVRIIGYILSVDCVVHNTTPSE